MAHILYIMVCELNDRASVDIVPNSPLIKSKIFFSMKFHLIFVHIRKPRNDNYPDTGLMTLHFNTTANAFLLFLYGHRGDEFLVLMANCRCFCR